MITKRLYYENAYCKEFDAKVIRCIPAEDAFDVVLNQTAFYPEGGGQPCDLGTIDGMRVLDVQVIDDEIHHTMEGPVEPGTSVSGKIDFTRRFDLMQQHSGEHMVSGLVHEVFGYNNVGFHMGTDVITIDFDGELTEQDLCMIEQRVNEAIWKNSPVQIEYPDENALADIPYRSKKELSGEVRIVTFPGVDICACCGIHVSHTGEIGMVKILSCVRFRGGVRVEMISGKRVLDYLNLVADQNHQISVLLSARQGQTAEAVGRLKEEASALHGEVIRLEEENRNQTAMQYKDAGDVLLFREEMSSDSLRRLTDAVMKNCGGRCAVFSASSDGGFKYAIGEQGGDLRELIRELNQNLNGRGGGKPFFVQGSVSSSKNEIEEFFRR